MFSESTESSIKSYEESYLKHLENEELAAEGQTIDLVVFDNEIEF